MLISRVCSAAFYCRRCGRTHIHDVPYFSGTGSLVLRCASCGSEQVTIAYQDARRLEFSVECIGCGTKNKFSFSRKELRHMQLEKIYCREENFELGYLGQRRRIEELLAFNQAEFNALHPHDGTGFLEKQELLWEALGRLQEMAERGDIACACGGQEIQAWLEGNAVIMECVCCGNAQKLPIEKPEDLANLGYGCSLSLQQSGKAEKNTAEKIS